MGHLLSLIGCTPLHTQNSTGGVCALSVAIAFAFFAPCFTPSSLLHSPTSIPCSVLCSALRSFHPPRQGEGAGANPRAPGGAKRHRLHRQPCQLPRDLRLDFPSLAYRARSGFYQRKGKRASRRLRHENPYNQAKRRLRRRAAPQEALPPPPRGSAGGVSMAGAARDSLATAWWGAEASLP